MQIPAKAYVCPYCWKRLRMSRLMLWCLMLLLFLFLIGVPLTLLLRPSALAETRFPAGNVSVSTFELYGATTTKDGVNKRATASVPFFVDSPDCGERFRIKLLRVRYENWEVGLDLAPELDFAIEKLFAGRGAEPRLAITFPEGKRIPQTVIALSRAINAEHWPEVGYVIRGTIEIDLGPDEWEIIPPGAFWMPDRWKRIDLFCE